MTDHKERAHNVGTEFTRTGSEPGQEQNFFDQATEFADKAIDEAAKIGKAAMDKDNRGRVAAGAAVGAVGAIVRPILSLPLGALAGAGYVAWRATRGEK